jgi:hypothetical protein
MNEDEFNKFYDAYKEYASKKKYNKPENNVFDFNLHNKKEKPKNTKEETNFKLSFGLKASETFIDNMDYRLDRIQKALDNLRSELYIYPEY